MGSAMISQVALWGGGLFAVVNLDMKGLEKGL